MKKAGRTSSAEMSTPAVALVPGVAPEPPEQLTAEQGEVWRRITATKPHDWFQPDTYDLLAQLCAHVVSFRKYTEAVENAELPDPSDYDAMRGYEKMVKLRDLESKRVESLMRSMRLTHQSRWQPKTAAGKSDKPSGKPWQT